MGIINNYSNIEQVNANKEMQLKVASRNRNEKTTRSQKEYTEYLSKRYSCLMPTKDSSVLINSSLLSKAISNPKTAAWLENTLSQLPACIEKICENCAMRGSKLVSLEISIDSENCIIASSMTISEADPGTDEAKKLVEKARERNKERREEWEKKLEKKKKVKIEEERLENIQKNSITVDDADTLLKRVESAEFWNDSKIGDMAFDMKI